MVDGCAILTEPELQGVLRHLNGLRELVVNKCSFISAKALRDFVHNLPTMELLEHNLVVLLDRKAAAQAIRKKERQAQMNMQTAQSLTAFDERYTYSRAQMLGVETGGAAMECPPALQPLLMELGISVTAGPG